ncbi:hypothetical protein SAMN06272739_2581 [Blastococcus haudaquaticus]|uniref:Uncharacterized protein n=2 Tax=Blastococcus haudaquaticus TaxID=1938745 RepID=A0A286GY23_9ACTN|nr:hypothetical protein SAMN06272739_2581 [Blastococcus haudaquaticus]
MPLPPATGTDDDAGQPPSDGGDPPSEALGQPAQAGSTTKPPARQPAAGPSVEGTGVEAGAATPATAMTAATAPATKPPVTEPAPAPAEVGDSGCSKDRLASGTDGRVESDPTPRDVSQLEEKAPVLLPSTPADAPEPAPPAPPPPAAPAPAPAPSGPCTAAPSGASSAGGAHDEIHSPLAVLGDAVTASLARESARAASSAAGHVVGGADDPGDSPD